MTEDTQAKATGRGKYFYRDLVTFQVESTTYRLPREGFERQSEVFKSMFELPQPEGPILEGAGEDNPIKLEGVSTVQFESLVEILYPSQVPYTPLNKDQLLAALGIAQRWEMNEVIHYIESALLRLKLSDLEKTALGKKHGLNRLLVEGYLPLVTGSRALGLEDAAVIGWDCVGQLLYLRRLVDAKFARERRCGWEDLACIKCGGCPRENRAWVFSDCNCAKENKATLDVVRVKVVTEEPWSGPTLEKIREFCRETMAKELGIESGA
ncbi:hypothetical protein CC1G_09209 [Coprinopsis cinerea okayama7|uniref:BTB domain-containing protein n=1 Tax=Coprinopsis cinerea (strain Okayama-7 / 130 / ATCC MYA-4618 / FGSC 9003) TaxID=240176 RepID=A8P4X4_COPC7|nr:hypothetical protein CC1G_09209 [Coprinopsis cinerea okayama7\|eukprot:XP_001838832.1 hypothetical protein CC1G_09209 [Coprinopsis cinerea okayama7\